MRITFFVSILAVMLNFALAQRGVGGPMAAVKPVGMMKRQPAMIKDADIREQEAPSLEKREVVFNALELVAAALFDDLPNHRRQSVISILTAMLVDEDDQMDMEEETSSTILPASREERELATSTRMAFPTSQIVESAASPTITPKAVKKMSLPERLRRAGARRNRRAAA